MPNIKIKLVQSSEHAQYFTCGLIPEMYVLMLGSRLANIRDVSQCIGDQDEGLLRITITGWGFGISHVKRLISGD